MNWLITGGCGFIGISLVSHLIKVGGHNIRILDNLSVGKREDLAQATIFREYSADHSFTMPKGVELVVGDILNDSLAMKVVNGCDVVVHLAANTGVGPSVNDPRFDMTNNVIGTFNYLEASKAKCVSRFVFASSGAPIGEATPPIHEELAPHPVSPYGASKLAGEGYCSAYKKTYGLDTVILRFGNVYGPGSIHKGSVIAKFIRQALAGDTVEIYGDGKQTRDFIYIDDLVDAIMLAASIKNIGGESFQIATNKESTVVEVAELLQLALKKLNGTKLDYINVENRVGDVSRNYSDVSKAKRVLGWAAKVQLSEGLYKTASYFMAGNKRR